ncbi:MAG: hypothetical protein KH921_09260 [Erysipelotrichaceae bacterium]|nr:hypothetical protein [Erysipelotrichaceae bacterium]
MKMRKRMLVSLLAGVLTLGSAVSVWAAGSRTSDVTVAGDGKFTVSSKIEETADYTTLKAEAPEVVALIDTVNAGTKDMKTFAEDLKGLLETTTDEAAKASLEKVVATLEGKDFVTGFFDLSAASDAEKNENGKYEVTLSLPALTDNTTDVEILHYSVARKLWETVEPTEVDKKAKTITAEFEDFSPVAIVAKEGSFAADVTEQSKGTSPKTEGVSVWMMWTAAAVLLVTGATVVYKKRNCR